MRVSSVDADAIVPAAVRERYASLPSTVSVRGRDVEIHYDVEESPEGNVGVARLRLPEKIARTLAEEELPQLDRPLRFIVTRGARGAARANTLRELQEELDRPFTEKEIADLERSQDEHRRERHERKRQRRVRDTGDELKEHRKSTSRDRMAPQTTAGRFKPPGGKGRGKAAARLTAGESS